MRKIHKITNIALIFMLIGVFLVNSTLYAIDLPKPTYLRAPLIFDQDDNTEEIMALFIEVLHKLIEELSAGYKGLEETNSLIEAIRVDPNFKDKLIKLDVKLCLDSLGRPWVFCEDPAIYFYIDKDTDELVIEGTVEELIEESSTKKLIRLIRTFTEEDTLEILKDELLLRLQEEDPFLVTNPLIGGLVDPDPAHVEYVEKFLLKIAEINPGAVIDPLGGALRDTKSRQPARKLLLKIAETNRDAVIELLEIILREESDGSIRKVTNKMLQYIERNFGYTSSRSKSKPNGSREGGEGKRKKLRKARIYRKKRIEELESSL